MDISLYYALLLLVTGFFAGIINTLAGGGSNLTLPALMVMGMPAEVANATNRVGVFLQSLTALFGFKRAKKLPLNDAPAIILPTIVGGLLGAVSASYLPTSLVKPALLITMLTMSLIILLKPSVISPDPGTTINKVADTPLSWIWLTIAGFYGGFVQAGVGFILLAALSGTLRYDLVKANALKVLCALTFTTVSLAVFIYNDLILWLPGLILAMGTMAGASVAVKIAITIKPSTLKWFLFIMTLVGCIAALFS
ncbi:sulfite exporter TauE/SafE family protein [Vibrio sp. SS-MA-C1-2]|uniref:sulfite exporter TauE/SafE family protein n=1 Tax=Vibrio sp. SS-MA-C1-2 TaxID=2908646 RepID=UPI001F434153|nr:sulfite exporter TauE/SafE family protein [Vibrio sp. SS-MA-C1-2]UJF18330.1 sulfite exporter TauE/SafE family protein [Vibrio sp. SS-MA-C1-2]